MSGEMSGGPDSSPAESAAITIAEAAQLLGVSASTARRLAASGQLPGLIGKLGSHGAWRVNRQALLDYVNRPLDGGNGHRRA